MYDGKEADSFRKPRNEVGVPREKATARSSNRRKIGLHHDGDALRWKVFDLVCGNLTDEAIGIAGDASKINCLWDYWMTNCFSPMIEHDNGFWLDNCKELF